MPNSVFIKNLYTKCRLHGSGDAQVVISDSEIYSLLCISVKNLKWSFSDININEIELPAQEYYDIPLDWFDSVNCKTSSDVIDALAKCFNKSNDFALFIENLTALHRRRVKYRRILSNQPAPTMDQIGPRVLLEYGISDTELLANWMVWRKWIYDIDNRSAQETGYLFEPLLASCLGGEPVGARNSPVKRLDSSGNKTNNGRQIDCFVPATNTAYELKLRVTIAASGQGRFGEELSFPVESQAAGLKPVLLVLDPTPSDRLTELSEKFIQCDGEFYHGDAAWDHMEEQAGEVVSVFIDKFIKPAIQDIESIILPKERSLSLDWSDSEIKISTPVSTYVINRATEC